MKIKLTNEAKHLAKVCGITYQELSDLVIYRGIEHGVFEDDEDYYGYTIAEHAHDEDISDAVLWLIFINTLQNVTLKEFKYYKCLETIGEGECPQCGGDIYFITDIYLESYQIMPHKVGERFECKVCSETIDKFD